MHKVSEVCREVNDVDQLLPPIIPPFCRNVGGGAVQDEETAKARFGCVPIDVVYIRTALHVLHHMLEKRLHVALLEVAVGLHRHLTAFGCPYEKVGIEQLADEAEDGREVRAGSVADVHGADVISEGAADLLTDLQRLRDDDLLSAGGVSLKARLVPGPDAGGGVY